MEWPAHPLLEGGGGVSLLTISSGIPQPVDKLVYYLIGRPIHLVNIKTGRSPQPVTHLNVQIHVFFILNTSKP